MNWRRKCSLTLLLVMLIFIISPGQIAQAQSTAPAPLARQLKIGCYTYSGSVIWSNSTMANWYAQRYSFAMGSASNSGTIVPVMQTVNPEFEALVYDLFTLNASDTVDVKTWALSKGYDFNSLVLRVASGHTVTVRADAYKTDGFGRFVTTVGPNVMLMPGFTNTQTRFCWDYRNPKVGEYLAYRWKRAIESIPGYSGAFVDEEGVFGYTGLNLAGTSPIMPPFREINTTYWQQGSPFTSLTNNWGSFDINGDGLKDYNDVKDSLARARDGWMKTAGNIMKSAGYFYAPNFAAVPTNNLGNWNGQGRHAGVLAGSYINGEYSYFYPGADGYELNCNNAVRTCYDVKDSSFNMFMGWTRMGQYDREQGKDYSRSKMTALGFWLDCLFPGTAEYYFSPCVKNGQVDFYANRTVGLYTDHDSTTMWCYAWGKYFGVPKTTRDTSQKGTDPAGQSYTIHKVTLGKPSDPNQTQTLAIGRYARGANFDLATTRVNVNVPAGTWFELNPNATWTRYTNTTIAVGNAEWRFLVSDTIIANSGVSAPSAGDSIPPAPVEDLGAVPGPANGEVTLTWSAPSDDLTARVYAYDIRYSTSSLSENNWNTATQASGEPSPKAGSLQETVVLTNLIPGAQFSFGLKSIDYAGNWSSISNIPKAVAKLTIVTEIDSCVPRPVGPPNGSLVAIGQPELKVQNAICSDMGAHEYTFFISDNPDFSTILASSPPILEGPEMTTWTPDTALMGGKRYYWRARLGDHQVSEQWYFDLKTESYMYPNPVNLTAGAPATFTAIPHGSNLIITTMSGDLVQRWTDVSGGDITWDGRNEAGNLVASGVYLWYVEGSSSRGKIVVVE